MTHGRKTILALLGLGALLAGGAGLTAALAGSEGHPAHSPAPGRFIWQDLITRDAESCRKFYSDLIGWEFSQIERQGKPYWVARAGGMPVGGIVEVKDPRVSRAAWLSYLAVEDLDGAVAAVQSAGGSVLVAPTKIGSLGRVAVVTDPQGAPLGLAGLAVNPPREPLDPVPGHFFWREYFAQDASKALKFYKDLGGYEDTINQRAAKVEYHILRREGPRAGLLQIPSALTDVKPNWLPYLKVTDPAALAARVESLGGEVILAPRPEIREGTVAVVADPTGGAIALQKWPS
jgi:predicted enzyme related to lactoylglutathione lyase